MTTRAVRRLLLFCALTSGAAFLYFHIAATQPKIPPWLNFEEEAEPSVRWADVPAQYPVQDPRPLPAIGGPIPAIQYAFGVETEEDKSGRLYRRDAVKAAFQRSWDAYRKYAWMRDEIRPLSNGSRDTFGGWGATLVDSLDTLYIMGMETEFDVAVAALKQIDFARPQIEEINVFETTIRYLGGLLAAHDLCGGKRPILLRKATELGDMLYAAFDTPNRMPVTRWNWVSYALSEPQEAGRDTISSELGSLSLEFTRLSQLTRDMKYFDAIDRVADQFERSQGRTKIPGLWPIAVNAKRAMFTDDRHFSLGGMADSLYEYLVKEHVLLGAATRRYGGMYASAVATAQRFLFFRPMLPDPAPDVLIAGSARAIPGGEIRLEPEGQHLTCFLGGMLALGAKALSRPEDLETARQITDGCVWAYDAMPSGIMPELFRAVPCASNSSSSTGPPKGCVWNEYEYYAQVASRYKSGTPDEGKDIAERMRLPMGFTDIADGRYILRPEAAESLFVMYRVTGDREWQDKAWRMFQAIEKATRTGIGYAALANVNEEVPRQMDQCESFWTAETLKYFYLIFSEPELVSLDEYVL